MHNFSVIGNVQQILDNTFLVFIKCSLCPERPTFMEKAKVLFEGTKTFSYACFYIFSRTYSNYVHICYSFSVLRRKW